MGSINKKVITGYIPQFSGNPEDLDDFVDMILADMTLEELGYYAVNNKAEDGIVTASGYLLPPGSVYVATDAIAGIDTDFPTSVTIGQTWNTDLAKQVGAVIGAERKATIASDDPNSLIYGALNDMRIIPLTGRIYEGLSEDPFLSSQMSDKMANGCQGDDDFYILAHLGTKHYTTYSCEWDRTDETNYINNRSLYEYQLKAFSRMFKNNHVGGAMTSFAAINGVPNAYSPYIKEMAKLYKYTPFNNSDFNGDANTLSALGNGYDKSYAITGKQIAAMMIKAGSFCLNLSEDSVSIQDFVDVVDENLFGLTRRDLNNHIRAQIEIWVRSGYFNQNGYPYLDYAMDKNPVTSSDEGHQTIALEAARESFVLLKNEGDVLPIAKDSTILVSGINAGFRVQAGYTVDVPDGIEYTGADYTPVKAIKEYVMDVGTINDVPKLSGRRVRLKSSSAGKYLVITSDGTITATAESADAAAVFLIYDWGQDAYSLATEDGEQILKVNDATVEMGENSPSFVSTFLTYEYTDEGQVLIRHGVFPTVIPDKAAAMPFYQRYSQMGNYLTVDNETKAVVLGSDVTVSYTAAALFEEEVVSEAGGDAADYVYENEYAVIIIGSNPYPSASEFDDRANIYFGATQLTMAHHVASQFPGKTIVVVLTNFPLAMEELHNDENIAAILYSSFAGQYDSYALAQILYGDCVPSGRLTATWLKDMSTLPKLTDELREAEEVDPHFTVYMKNADPQQLGLTYLYNNPEDATYHFGYGLSYTSFEYSDITFTRQQEALDHLIVTLAVTNSGSIDGKEVVQIYAAMLNSEYGAYVPKRQLVGFEKTEVIAAGESVWVTIEIYPEDLEKFDVTRQEFIVEQGTYKLMVGKSSNDIVWEQEVWVIGEEIGEIDLTSEINVWESSYASMGTRGIEVSKGRTAQFAGRYFAVQSVEDGDYVIMPNVKLDNTAAFEVVAASTNDSSTIDFYIDEIGSRALTSVTFAATDTNVYDLGNDETLQVTELGYAAFTTDSFDTIEGSHDLYIVFRDRNIRIDSIKAADGLR